MFNIIKFIFSGDGTLLRLSKRAQEGIVFGAFKKKITGEI